jgi:hypothetical protein
MRIFLFQQRERRRSVREIDRVPSLGPHNRKREVVGIIEI